MELPKCILSYFHLATPVIVEVKDKHSSIIICELSAMEEKSIDAVMKTGLGIELAHPKSKPKSMPEPTPSASAGSKQDHTHVERELQDPTSKVKPRKDTSPQMINPPKAVDSKVFIRDIQIKVAKLSMKPDQRLHVSQKLLATYPMSKCRPPNYYPLSEDHGIDHESIK